MCLLEVLALVPALVLPAGGLVARWALRSGVRIVGMNEGGGEGMHHVECTSGEDVDGGKIGEVVGGDVGEVGAIEVLGEGHMKMDDKAITKIHTSNIITSNNIHINEAHHVPCLPPLLPFPVQQVNLYLTLHHLLCIQVLLLRAKRRTSGATILSTLNLRLTCRGSVIQAMPLRISSRTSIPVLLLRLGWDTITRHSKQVSTPVHTAMMVWALRVLAVHILWEDGMEAGLMWIRTQAQVRRHQQKARAIASQLWIV